MRAAVCVLVLLLLPACLSAGEEPPEPRRGDADDGSPFLLPLFLKGPWGLSTVAPENDAPVRVSATAFQNAFTNEDLDAFSSKDPHPHYNITKARLSIFYAVDAPLVAPVGADPQGGTATHLVFWIGSRNVFVANTGVVAEAALLPGRVYEAQLEFALPEPGWIVPRNEPLMLLFANLVPSATSATGAMANLHFLVDSPDTPSRIELEGSVADVALPEVLFESGRRFTLLGNTALFTGASPEQVPQRIETVVNVPTLATYAEVRVVFQSTASGKSDLDFTLYAPDGTLAGASTTPYQNETVRLFPPQISRFGAGDYRVEVTAYSGANTAFDVRLLLDATP